jgi:hypothetical protein
VIAEASGHRVELIDGQASSLVHQEFNCGVRVASERAGRQEERRSGFIARDAMMGMRRYWCSLNYFRLLRRPSTKSSINTIASSSVWTVSTKSQCLRI